MCYSATYPICLLPISHRGGGFLPYKSASYGYPLTNQYCTIFPLDPPPSGYGSRLVVPISLG